MNFVIQQQLPETTLQRQMNKYNLSQEQQIQLQSKIRETQKSDFEVEEYITVIYQCCSIASRQLLQVNLDTTSSQTWNHGLRQLHFSCRKINFSSIQDYLFSSIGTIFTSNRVFNSPTNSIDSKQFILISTGPSHCRKGINIRINKKDKTKSIPPGFIYGSSLTSKLQMEITGIPTITLISCSKKFQMVLNYIIVIQLIIDNF
ncbi:Hypothetical_protein [Hexamita inflata]|uniref:Hypothetical_protein n=1 Tax=Hexamita inflata TaxID=28002 RepID=A0ABP1HC87_9EUKA